MYKLKNYIENDLKFIKNNCKTIKYMNIIKSEDVSMILFEDIITQSILKIYIKDFSLDFLINKIIDKRIEFNKTVEDIIEFKIKILKLKN